MEQYRVADEVIRFSSKYVENELRFKAFLTTTEDAEVDLRIQGSYLEGFQKNHRNLSLAQCELILSMRSFYDYLIKKENFFCMQRLL
ncbi:hypothetical protein SAMN05216391_11760 [Lachnospiraceae bacterium KHCPX20]|nr:hypothetical protein SAMN05216391_11760 [Lachnospiraceae bacterium KHCPX20]